MAEEPEIYVFCISSSRLEREADAAGENHTVFFSRATEIVDNTDEIIVFAIVEVVVGGASIEGPSAVAAGNKAETHCEVHTGRNVAELAVFVEAVVAEANINWNGQSNREAAVFDEGNRRSDTELVVDTISTTLLGACTSVAVDLEQHGGVRTKSESAEKVAVIIAQGELDVARGVEVVGWAGQLEVASVQGEVLGERHRNTGTVIELEPSACGAIVTRFVGVEARPETEIEVHSIDEPFTLVEAEIEIQVRLSNDALVFENDAARDVLAHEVDPEVTSDAGLLNFLNDCLRLFAAGFNNCAGLSNEREAHRGNGSEFKDM